MADAHAQATLSTAEIVRTVEPSLVCIRTPTSSGSGFVVDDSGNVITNAHVVGHHVDVTLEFVNGTVSAGTVVGTDWNLDLACIRMTEPIDMVPLSLGDSDAARVGEDVLAMGYPLSDILSGSPTVTRGIISAKRPGSLQTDAAINPGSSGGPLVDSRGRVIGVNTSVLAPIDGRKVEGIGFAIPINLVKDQLASLTSGASQVNSYTRESEDPCDGNWKTHTVTGKLKVSVPGNWRVDQRGRGSLWFTDSESVLRVFLPSQDRAIGENAYDIQVAAESRIRELEWSGIDLPEWTVTHHGWEEGPQGRSYAITFEGYRANQSVWRVGECVAFAVRDSDLVVMIELDTPLYDTVDDGAIRTAQTWVAMTLESLMGTIRIAS